MKTKKARFLKQDLNQYKEKLFNLRDEIAAQIQDLSKDTLMKTQRDFSGDISGYGIHMADVATDNYEREFNLGLVSNEQKVLTQIDDALKRIEEKSYGICLACGRSISKRRLDAIPHVSNCKKCQEKIEKEEKRQP
ncbi:MAG: TraR/DksA C4-type zinc finger protein [Candidatus Omnitrophica bacterium]|nr:TraR/DksA C4-type zinc finger protein [Candidatus Omnitrophota bacterium]